MKKEKGFFRRFLEWLRTPDEDEIEGGKINIKAFKDEDKELINALNGTAKRVDHTASTTFIDRAEKRAETIKGMKAEVETPNMKAKENQNQILGKYLEEK